MRKVTALGPGSVRGDTAWNVLKVELGADQHAAPTTTQGWMRHLRVLGDINHLPPETEWNRGKRKIVLGVQNNLSITTMTLATLMTGSRRIL